MKRPTIASAGDLPAGTNPFEWILEASKRLRIERQAMWLPSPRPALDRAAMALADAKIEEQEQERLNELRKKYRKVAKLPASAAVEN